MRQGHPPLQLLDAAQALKCINVREADVGHEVIRRWDTEPRSSRRVLSAGRTNEPQPSVGQVLLAIGAVKVRKSLGMGYRISGWAVMGCSFHLRGFYWQEGSRRTVNVRASG